MNIMNYVLFETGNSSLLIIDFFSKHLSVGVVQTHGLINHDLN